MTEGTGFRVADEPLLFVTREDLEDVVLLSFAGEADMSTAALVQSSLDAAFDNTPAMIVLDLTNLTFVDSTTISLWVIARQRAEAAGSLVRIAGANGIVDQVIDISGLDTFFVVTDTVREALELPRDIAPRQN